EARLELVAGAGSSWAYLGYEPPPDEKSEVARVSWPTVIAMEQATPPESEQPTVQQMFMTLLGEIATLRRQNEDQQRQLEHLRNTTSLLLERENVSRLISGKALTVVSLFRKAHDIWRQRSPNG
ncbi:hypothetical protein DHEL01_v211389, partial [Diaporthe helianthi]